MIRAVLTLLMAGVCVWGAMALAYRAPGRIAAWSISLWSAFGIACMAGLWTGQPAAAGSGFALAYLALLGWWKSLSPSNDRPWAEDVARVTHGLVEGGSVTLHNVRNFDWRTDADFTPRWESRRYDLDRLQSTDVIMSYWAGEAIAHTLISFGFGDGARVVFSVEVRRERTRTFSEIGGFFKDFELSVIAADESDIVRLRTNVRRERTYLYRLRLPRSAMRTLFLGYVAQANDLLHRARFYHTLTGNCTIVVWHLLKRAVGPLPLSYRLWLSGYLPEYLYAVGLLDTRRPLGELRSLGFISARGLAAGSSPTYSADIRRGIPEL